MKRILLFLTFSITVFCLKAQDVGLAQDSIQKEDDGIFEIADQMPEFPGGVEVLRKYLSVNVRYPIKAIESKTQGTVVVTAVIEKDGSISNITIVRSVSKELDKEAIRVVSTMQNWIPGKLKGVPVRVRMNFPIKFKLQ